MRIVQAVVAVAPPLLILWMGGTYLLDAGRLLLAPGVPLAFDYKSPEGRVRFSAAGYRIDPDRKTIATWGVRATRSNGVLLGSVDNVDVSGLDPFALRPDVRITGAYARLERDEKGLDLARLLPKQEGPPSKIPYSVTVLNARLLYVDRTFQKPLTQRAETRRVVVDGVGEDWRASGTVILPGIGNADVRAQSLPAVGATLDLRSNALHLERVAPLLVPGLRARSLIARGPVRIDIPKKGKARVATTMRAEAKGIVYGQYQVDSVAFDGRASEEGIQGAIIARIGEIRARFKGTATREAGAGQVVASLPSPQALPEWVRKYLPAKTDFRDASYDGWVAWSGKTPRLDGIARASRATYGDDSVDAVRAHVAYSPDSIDLRGLSASWKGAPLAGDVSYRPATRAIRGVVVAPRVELAALSRRFDGPDVSGVINGEALLSGTSDRPEVEGRLAGRVALQGRSLGDIEARGAWLAGAARVDRLRVSGPLGAIVAGGTVRPDGTLSLKAEARGLRIERLMPEARGLVSANLNVGGTLRAPKATGRVEAYRLAFEDQTLPAAAVDITADRRRIALTGLTAVRGTARLRGRVSAALVGKGVNLSDPRTWLLDGRFALTGVQANYIPGAEDVGDLAGLLSVPRADLSGRLGDPVVTAGLEADGLIVRGVRIESLRADARVDRRGAKVTNLETLAAGGRVVGNADYAFASRNGDVNLQIADLQLSRLLTDLSEDVMVTGTVSAPRVHLAIRNGKPVGEAEGTLAGVKVNDVLAGDGNWTLEANGERIRADASVGRLDPTLRALDASVVYNVEEGSLAANVQAKDVPLQAVVAAAESKRSRSEEEADRLAKINGDLSGTVQIVRSRDGELKVDANDLQAAAIRYFDTDYGTLTIGTVQRRGGRWSLSDALLEGSAGTFSSSGWVEEDGELSLLASGTNVRVSAFAPFAPDLASITGTAHFAITATGMVDRPQFTGTLGADGLLAKEGKESLGFSIDRLDVRNGRSEVAGVVRYGERFGGLFSATTDWSYRSPISAATLQAKVDLGTLQPLDPADTQKGLRIAPVDLRDIPGLRDYIDPARGGGTLTGGFTASGTVGEPRIGGGLELLAERLGITVPGSPGRPITRVDDLLRDVKINLGFDERNAPLLTSSVRFDRGGTVLAMATLGDLGREDVFTVLSKTRDWKGLPVSGYVRIDDKSPVTISQRIGGAESSATIAGGLKVSGQAVTPEIKGAFVLSNVNSSLPSVETSAGESSPPLLDPTFDLTFALAQAGLFKTATAELYLTGDLAVKGPLSNPVAQAELITERGSIRLPGGNVRIDKGGQISFAYKRPLSGGTPASADLDLQGRSQVTVVRQGQSSQRYDIVLDVQGDLLSENGLKLNATSDPPDLSRDEILNALGRTDLLQGFASGGSSTERNLRSAFAGFALPGLLDPITGGIAKFAGLDYFSLEYDDYSQATINFARSLGQDFTFQGRQQVGTPTPGYRAVYDLRLSFNPRRLLPKLSRFSVTVGTDQDRPWKTSIEYGTRFGQRGGTVKPKHTLFPAKK